MELTKNFEPAAIEAKWTAHWKNKEYFKSTPDNRVPFTVVIPPPNVTGVLHMGHTLNETVQDILIRRARMSGYNACWVPGSDHASIATEAKVVQMLKDEKGIDKNTLTRQEFLQYAFEWKEKYGGIIYNQIERLGCSVDWDRVTFTMDDHYYKAVIKVFIDLYNKGMIYRGARMINWDPVAKTALSDEEVEYKEVQSKLYYVRYRLDNTSMPAGIANEPGFKYWRATDLLLKAKKTIADLVKKVKSDSSNTIDKTIIGSVTKEGAEFLSALTGVDISVDYKHIIDRSSIYHVLNKHGNESEETSRGQIAITEKDFESIPDILNNPDDIFPGKTTKTNLESITYIKSMGDGSFIYLEEVRTGKKELCLVSMRKMKGKTGLESSLTNRRAMPSAETESFSGTSETTPVKAKIPKIIDFSILANETDNDESYITIATTRPETILGDTAICVNPTDERYQHLKGVYAFVPLINRRVPIIFDEYVDKEFGTGALKITPAHDINDYNIGLKHNLEVVDTLNDDGTLSEAAQLYVGEDRFEVRKKISADLEKSGNLVKTEAITNKNGFSQRSHAVVEPKISTQWFLKMKELAQPALKAVVDGDIKIHPGDRFLATYKHWLENVKDWCISRQLWWGQQIPAWYDKEGNVYVAETEEDAKRQMQSAKGIEPSALSLSQDEDVLDTWFSSWLWPSEVFHGITNPGNDDIKYYYPTSVLVTGQDIIFFWVARMIMAGLEYEKEIPFKDVYFTGMVRDSEGRKMSKQLGNSPDLLKLIDTYGADAVRFGIMISAPAGNDLLFDESSLEQGRNFNNKMWNALKLIRTWENNPNGIVDVDRAEGHRDFASEWMLNRINDAKAGINKLFEEFKISEALKTIYSLVWDDFCSWYLEWQKPAFGDPTDSTKLKVTKEYFAQLLQLLHPFMPFITEEISKQLNENNEDVSISQIEKPQAINKKTIAEGELLKQAITAIRDARVKNKMKPKDPLNLFVQTENKESYRPISEILIKQAVIEDFDFTETLVDKCVNVLVGKDKLYLQPKTALDTSSQKEQLEKDLDYLQGFLNSVEKKLGNERFMQNAKPEVVELERRKKADAEEKIKLLKEALAAL